MKTMLARQFSRIPSSESGIILKKDLMGNIVMENRLQRISYIPRVLHGKPLIRGLCIFVEMILELLEKGSSGGRFWKIFLSYKQQISRQPCFTRSFGFEGV